MGSLAIATVGSPVGAATNEDSSSVLVRLLDVQHPEYKAKIGAWQDLAILAEGGVKIKEHAARFLQMRPREDGAIYSGRLEKFTYQNILGTAIGWYSSSLFECQPEVFLRDKKNKDIGPGLDKDYYTRFADNCNLCDVSFTDFFQQVFFDLLVYGVSWVLTDLPAAAPMDGVPTLQAQKESGALNAYVARFTPMEVINWGVDVDGVLEWVVIKEVELRQEFLKPATMVTTWYYYDRETFRVYVESRQVKEGSISVDDANNRRAELVRQSRHPLANSKRVPIRKISLTKNLWLANRVYLQVIDHLNQDNTLAWALFMSNLAVPVIIGDVDTANMTVSETGYLQFPAGTTYGWSEPTGNSFDHSAKRLESQREEIYRSMYLTAQGRSMRATPAMQSGRSKQLEMQPATEVKRSMGTDLARAMQAVLLDVIAARGQEGEVFPDVRGFVFDDDMTTEEVFAVTSMLNLRVPSRTFEKLLMKKTARSWMGDANRKEIDKVYEEIEAGPTMEEREKKEFDERVKLARAGMSKAISASSGPQQPPGRGGAGPSPRSDA